MNSPFIPGDLVVLDHVLAWRGDEKIVHNSTGRNVPGVVVGVSGDRSGHLLVRLTRDAGPGWYAGDTYRVNPNNVTRTGSQ